MSEFKTVRGMRDFLPGEASLLRFIEAQTRKVADLYGYSEIITPIVESHELLTAKAGDEIRSRMFVFRDLGDRMVALRPEFTASVARMVASTLRKEPRPFRLFSVGSIYRYDEPQKGRYREFWQSNFELMGSSRAEADAEIILLTNTLLQLAKVKKPFIKVGHVGVLRNIFTQERLPDKVQNSIMQLMDKKMYDKALRLVSENIQSSLQCCKILEELVSLKETNPFETVDKMEALVKDYPRAVEATLNLREILGLIMESECKIDLRVDAGFARGLEYYTGMIFEVYSSNLDTALGGGGRYDKLIELFGGAPTPAVGVAHGLDRIMLALQDQGEQRESETSRAVIIPIGQELTGKALRIAQMLRERDIRVELEVMGRKIAKVLEDADKRRVDFAVIVGKKELKEDSVVVRDLAERGQRALKIADLAGALTRKVRRPIRP